MPPSSSPQSNKVHPRFVAVRRLVIIGGTLAAAALMARWILFAGPYQPREATPNDGIIDLHCHTAGIGGGDSGCFISRRMRDSYKFDIYLKAFGTDRAELESKGDGLLVQRIATQVSASRRVGMAVVLAMDGVIDAKGDLDRTLTEVYVPNEFIATQVARYTNLLFGASINPHRPDALARLNWCAAHGAVLVKWIPSVMHIDPSEERWIPFYKRLVELGIPLLSHTGQERSFTEARDELCDPTRLRLPLRLGVKVIAAHIASTGSNQGQRDTDRLKPLMLEYTNLWSEISSLTQANKPGYLQEALTAPEFKERLLYGSDFPLMNTALVSPWFFPLSLTHGEMQRLSELDNPWDRDVELKQALGVPARLFTRAREVLRMDPRSEPVAGR